MWGEPLYRGSFLGISPGGTASFCLGDSSTERQTGRWWAEIWSQGPSHPQGQVFRSTGGHWPGPARAQGAGWGWGRVAEPGHPDPAQWPYCHLESTHRATRSPVASSVYSMASSALMGTVHTAEQLVVPTIGCGHKESQLSRNRSHNWPAAGLHGGVRCWQPIFSCPLGETQKWRKICMVL